MSQGVYNHKSPKKITKTCLCGCGEEFSTTKKRNKKYFSRKCYIKDPSYTSKLSTASSKSWIDNKTKIIAGMKAYHNTPQAFESKSNTMRRAYENPILRQNKSKETTKRMKDGFANYLLEKRWSKEDAKTIQSKKMREAWSNTEYKNKRVAKIMKSMLLRPNKKEATLLSTLHTLFPNKYQYVGDGTLIIGGKNPDFVNKKDKKLIEHFGTYWHKGENPQERINHFKKNGYDCLVIWESELKDMQKVMQKLKEFEECPVLSP